MQQILRPPPGYGLQLTGYAPYHFNQLEQRMTATLIDGTAIAADIRQKIAARVAELTAATGRKPGLATVLVGEDPASQAYVRMKGKNSLEVGMESFSYKLPATASQEEVEGLVRDLNANSAVNGILVQLPLPKHLDEEAILGAISLEKDVDGFHPVNIGRLVMKGRSLCAESTTTVGPPGAGALPCPAPPNTSKRPGQTTEASP